MRGQRVLILAVLALAFNAEVRAESRLWDSEPKFCDVAKDYTYIRPLPAEFGMEGPCMPRGAKGKGINLCNGELKLALWGSCSNLVVSISKTDVWNRWDPLLPWQMPSKTQPVGSFWVKPFAKPVGRLALQCADFAGAEQPDVVTSVNNGLNTFTMKNNKATAELKYLVTRRDSNIIAISAKYSGLTSPLLARIYRFAIKQGESSAGNDGKYFWVQHKFPGEKTFPAGFEFYFVGKVVGAPAALTSTNNTRLVAERKQGFDSTARIAPDAAGRVLIYATIVTTAEAADPFAEAKKRLTDAEARGFDALVSDNEQWFNAMYERREQGRIFTGDLSKQLKDILMPFFFFGSWQNRHTWQSSPDPTKYEGDALYSDLEAESARWSGLPCFDEETYTGEYVAGRGEGTSLYYVNLVNFWRKAWEKNAADKGYKGMLFLYGYVPPIKPDVYYSWDPLPMYRNGWHSMCWAYKSVWDEFDYGGRDDEFLRDKVYPGLRNIADFFSSLVKMGDDGFYHIEESEMRENVQGKDAMDCIASAKWAWRTAIIAATILKTNQDRCVEWRKCLDKIVPYYRMPDGTYGGIVKKGVVEQHKWLQHFPINVSDEFNLDLPQEERDRAFNSCSGVPVLNADTGHLLGKNPDYWAGDSGFERNQWLMYFTRTYAPSFTNAVTNVTCLVSLISPIEKTMACWFEPERLCNSRSGTIYLFPCVPSKFDVAFKDMQARGGFLVSAEWKGGAVTYASIKARRSGECKVMNPWPGKGMKVLDLPGRKEVKTVKDADAERYRFAAEAGRAYAFEGR